MYFGHTGWYFVCEKKSKTEIKCWFYLNPFITSQTQRSIISKYTGKPCYFIITSLVAVGVIIWDCCAIDTWYDCIVLWGTYKTVSNTDEFLFFFVGIVGKRRHFQLLLFMRKIQPNSYNQVTIYKLSVARTL